MQNALITDITNDLSRKKPTAREPMIAAIKQSLRDANLKIIDTHNTTSVIFVVHYGCAQVLLKAEFGSNTATHREIGWYEHQAAAGKDQHKLFLGGMQSDTYALLFLRYIEGALTLDEWMLEASASGNGLGKHLVEALNYDKSLFFETSKQTSRDEAGRFLLNKYLARREEARRTAYLNDLLSASHISINGRRYLTPDFAVAKIAKNASNMKRLLPTRMGLIHGDLHTGNILTKEGDLFYIDPNGNFDMPIEYDIGKLLHSVHGQYPQIMQGRFRICADTQYGYEYAVDENVAYREAYEYLRDALTYDEYLRGLYTEALHFATMLPHHARNRAETLALYLRAVELFDELLILL